MPIYAYRCTSCGHAKDVLQKVSDPVLTVCPACHAETFKKQLTAAGFQLKGSGWYVTDFRGGNSNGSAKGDADAKNEGGKTESAKGEGAAKTDSVPAAASSADSASTGGCGASCTCH